MNWFTVEFTTDCAAVNVIVMVCHINQTLFLTQLVKAYKMELAQPGKTVGQVMRLNMMPDAPIAVNFKPRS